MCSIGSLNHWIIESLTDWIQLRTDEDQLTAELIWAASRPGSLWKRQQGGNDDESDQKLEHPPLTSKTAFQDCFTEWELRAFEEYVAKKPDSVYSMNQDPTARATYARGQACV